MKSLHLLARLLVLVLFTACVGSSVRAPVDPYKTMRHWAPPVAQIYVPSAPACLRWSVEEALKVLKVRTPVEVLTQDGVFEATPGTVVVHWQSPSEEGFRSAMGLSRLQFRLSTGGIFAADTFVLHCDVRLLSHELGHVFGLLDKDLPGDLMHWTFPTGGWRISEEERRVLDRSP